MEVVVLFFFSSLVWAIGVPIAAYPYYKKLKNEYNCSKSILAFTILTGILILATPCIAYAIFIMFWFNKTYALLPLLPYPFCITIGLYLFYQSFTKGKTNKSIWYLATSWITVILLAGLSFIILDWRNIFL